MRASPWGRYNVNSTQRQSFVIGLSAFSASLLLFALVSILSLIVIRGGSYFWPVPVYAVAYDNPLAGQSGYVYAQVNTEYHQENRSWWLQYSDLSRPFGGNMTLTEDDLVSVTLAKQAARIVLDDGRVLLANPLYLKTQGAPSIAMSQYDAVKAQVAAINQQLKTLRAETLSPVHEAIAELDRRGVAEDAPARLKLNQTYQRLYNQSLQLEMQIENVVLVVAFASNEIFQVQLSEVTDLDYPGQLNWWQKVNAMFDRMGVFLTDSPKQANTAGGVFPALFGTILMVLLMTVIVAPFGVLAAVYLNEYAPSNWLTSIIRISVSNMAGVPSIVYGVFGLGFFVYYLGGNLDALFFSDALPAPTFGSPGLFWAALTMALLTLPVVIVSTEEGLRRVPENLRSGSYALGATKFETIWYTVLPHASPGVMTGIILAIARAAGEVAPLMLVGAVKFAPSLPIDSEFPYLHLERQFMHLGVLIYDGAFHSQTNSTSASMMFAACLLLLIVVFVLNIIAVVLRTRLRRLYSQG